MKLDVYKFKQNKKGRWVSGYETQVTLNSLSHVNILKTLVEKNILQTKKNVEITKVNENDIIMFEIDDVLNGTPLLNLVGKK